MYHNGNVISGTTYTVTVVPSVPSQVQRTRTDPLSATAGADFEIQFVVKDRFGNICNLTSQEISKVVVSSLFGDVPVTLVANPTTETSILMITGSASRVGKYAPSAHMDSIPLAVSGSSMDLEILAADPDVQNSHLYLATEKGEWNNEAGIQKHLWIQLVDRFGNFVTEMPPSSLVQSLVSTSDSPIDCTFSIGDVPERFVVGFTPKTAGTSLALVTVGSQNIRGSPMELEISPSYPDPSSCLLSGISEIQEIVAGSPITFGIESRDRPERVT